MRKPYLYSLAYSPIRLFAHSSIRLFAYTRSLSDRLCLPLLLCVLLLVQACAVVHPAGREERRARLQLQDAVMAILARPELDRMSIGVKAVSLLSGETLFAHHPGRLFHPASNTKLATAVAALKTLGLRYRFATVVYMDADAFIRADTLYSALYLRGGGDPLLTTDDLDTLAQRIAGYGIRTIAGDLVADDTRFDDRRLGAGWMWDDVEYSFSPQLSALTVNANCVTVVVSPGDAVGDTVTARLEPPTSYVTVQTRAVTGPPVLPDSLYRPIPSPPDTLVSAGHTHTDTLGAAATPQTATYPPLTIARQWIARHNTIDVTGQMPLGAEARRALRTVEDPARYAATLFRERLAARGVALTGTTVSARTPFNAAALTVYHSDPLPAALGKMLKDSDNLTAELLIKTIGVETTGPPGRTEDGLRFARRTLLNTAGLDTLQYVWVDGSGLSWYNLFTPSQIVDLLIAVYRDDALRAAILAALPIAGVDGTLAYRMQDNRAYQNVRAKTGTLSGVSCLSGYVWTRDGEPVAFSIMMNHYTGSALKARQAQDDIGAALAGFSRRGRLAARE